MFSKCVQSTLAPSGIKRMCLCIRLSAVGEFGASACAMRRFGLRGKGHELVLKANCNAQFLSNEDYLICI